MRVYIIIADSSSQGARNETVYFSKILAERECERLNRESHLKRLERAKQQRDLVEKIPISLDELARSQFAYVAPDYRIDEKEVQLLTDEINLAKSI